MLPAHSTLMKTFYYFLLSAIIFITGCSKNSDQLIMASEWEKQEAVLINYSGDPEHSPTTSQVHEVCINAIRELATVTKVFVLINEEFGVDSLKQVFVSRGIQTDNVTLVPVYELFSMGVPRDYGPMITTNEKGERVLMRFDWDYIGADFENPDTVWTKERDYIRDRYFDQMSKLLKMNVKSVPLAIEGGEIEMNGKGTAIMVDSFNVSRNPGLTKEQLQSLLEQNLGVKKLIWLREGVAEDPGVGRKARIADNIYGYGVGGHIDEFCRFINDTTLFLAMPSVDETMSDPIKKITYDRMKVNEDILNNATS